MPLAPAEVRKLDPFHWRGALTLAWREIFRTLRWAQITVLAQVFTAVVLFLVFRFALGVDNPEQAAVLDFIVPGLIVLAVMQRAFETPSISLIYDKYDGSIVDITMAPLKPAEYALGYILSGAATGLISGAAVFLAAMVIWPLGFSAPLVSLGFAILGGLLLATIGFLLGLLGDKWDHLEVAISFVVVPLSFLSGVFAPVERLPGILPAVMAVNPIAYVIDGFRFGVAGAAAHPPLLSALFVCAALAALWGLAYFLLLRGIGLRS